MTEINFSSIVDYGVGTLTSFVETYGDAIANPQGDTLFHFCMRRYASGRYRPHVGYLFSRGANANAQNAAGDTPVHCTAVIDDDLLRMMEGRRVDLDLVNGKGVSVLAHVLLIASESLADSALASAVAGFVENARPATRRAARAIPGLAGYPRTLAVLDCA